MILEEGIKIIELSFPDGNSPPKDIIKKWLKLIKDNLAMVEETKNGDLNGNEEFKNQENRNGRAQTVSSKSDVN